MKLIAQLLLFMLPWRIRSAVYRRCFGFQIAPTARIGFSVMEVTSLTMEEGARIGHLCMFRGLSAVHLHQAATIGNLNWFTASPMFAKSEGDIRILQLGAESAITNRHYVDVQNRVTIGKRTTLAGVRSTVLTHSINIAESRQESAPVTIGDCCFIGTNVVILAGVELCACAVVGAGAVVTHSLVEGPGVYAGVPARLVKRLDGTERYFHRDRGFVSKEPNNVR